MNLPSTNQKTRVSIDSARPSSASSTHSSLDATKEFYNISSTSSKEKIVIKRTASRQSSAHSLGSSTSGNQTLTSSLNHTPQSTSHTHSSSILPSTSFFSPLQAGVTRPASAPRSAVKITRLSTSGAPVVQVPLTTSEASAPLPTAVDAAAPSPVATEYPPAPGESTVSLETLEITEEKKPEPPHVAIGIPAHEAPRVADARHIRTCLGGRALTSQDSPVPLVFTLLAALFLPVLFIAFNAPYLWQHLGKGGKASIFIFIYLAAVMLVNLCFAAFRDPGILPRGLDPEPKRKYTGETDNHSERPAEPRYVRLKEGVVACKWCTTCHTYRPPRTSHCRVCDNCVDQVDHHCTFLNNCVGKRNYLPFFTFLTTSLLCGIYALAFSIWHIVHAHSLTHSLKAWHSAGSLVVLILTFIVIVPISGLWGYHVFLIWTNKTTIEMLRPASDRTGAFDPATGNALGNVYKFRSRVDNVIYKLCRPTHTESFIQQELKN